MLIKDFSGATTVSVRQTVLNVLMAAMLLSLSVCVGCMFVQISELKAAVAAGVDTDEHQRTELQNPLLPVGATHEVEVGNLKRRRRQALVDESGQDSAPHEHQRQRCQEWFTNLQSQIDGLREPQRSYYTHLRLCKRGSSCYRSYGSGAEDFARWADDMSQGPRSPWNTATMYTRNNMSTPIIPEEGLYHVYGQVSWKGRSNNSILESSRPANSFAGFNIVTLPDENSNDTEVSLLSSLTTQHNLGAKLNITQTHRNLDDYPYDSAFVSGNVFLRRGQILAVKLNPSGTVIKERKDSTFLGYYLLQRTY